MRLKQREKIVIAAGLVILLGLGYYFFLVEPLQKGRIKLESNAKKLHQDLRQMHVLAAQYKGLSKNRDQLEKQVKTRGQGFKPMSYLENLAKEVGLTGRIESMTPVTSLADDGRTGLTEIDLRFSGIGLKELVKFLYRIESSEKVFWVVNLNIRPRYLTPHFIDVSLRLASPNTV